MTVVNKQQCSCYLVDDTKQIRANSKKISRVILSRPKCESRRPIVMEPRYERLDSNENRLFEIPFGKFALVVVSLPLFSFVFCVVWSILYFFERSTSTHCGVDNYLPSISAAIGNYQPQRFVWQFAILLQALPRFLVAHQYHQFYNDIIRMNRRSLANFACVLNVIENFALVGLSLWTSADDYGKSPRNLQTSKITCSSCVFLLVYFRNA